MSVLVKLNGGLGNQMFQYAAGKLLAKDLNRDLSIDIFYLKKGKRIKTERAYSLDLFTINDPIIESSKLDLYINKLFYDIQKGTHRKLLLDEIRSDRYNNYKRFSKIVLNGYFQQLSPLENNIEYIQDLFNFHSKLKLAHKPNLEEIESQNSISIHIRRGDYLSKINQEIYHTCDISYYKEAILQMKNTFPDAVFHVFSDDQTWALNNLPIKMTECRFSNYGKNDQTDFFLMSRCKHHIIANSTFSWWAAFLNKNPDKKVFAPKLWYKNNTTNNAALNLLPKSWQIL